MSASQCSSGGCESGWTFYLDQSYARVEDNEEEGLSMVSDASSGPPYYGEDYEDYCSYKLASTIKSKDKRKSEEHSRSLQQHSYLDDTASSSPVSSKEAGKNPETTMDHVLEFSQGFSATHFKGKSSLKKHFRMLQSENSGTKEQPGGFQARKWK